MKLLKALSLHCKQAVLNDLISLSAILCCFWTGNSLKAQALLDGDAGAIVEVRLAQVAEEAPPLGVNDFGDQGGTPYAYGNLLPGGTFEPANMRWRFRVLATGVENGIPWAELEGNGGMTIWDLVTTGFLNGAQVRVYRIVDAEGNPLPTNEADSRQDLSHADRYIFVGNGNVPEAGSPGLPLGGWVDTLYAQTATVFGTRENTSFTDTTRLTNGQSYYYSVTAVSDGGTDIYNPLESDSSLSDDLSATPSAEAPASGPYIRIVNGDALSEMPAMTSGVWFDFVPEAVAAHPPLTWELLNRDNQSVSSIGGLSIDPASGRIVGVPDSTPAPTPLRLRLTAANGSATRDLVLNQAGWIPTQSSERPLPPQNITLTPGDGFVHLSWDPSPSPNVIGYRVRRSIVPAAEQRRRVYFDDTMPTLARNDYLHFDKRTTTADPSWAHGRVYKGVVFGSWQPGWATIEADFSHVPHPGELPAEMRFPGETCGQIVAIRPDLTRIMSPALFFPDQPDNAEAEWYASLEPSKTYRYEAWMRQDGNVANDQVSLAFWGPMYPNLAQTFSVDNEWRLYSFEFVAPPRPTDQGSHSGAEIRFAGMGTVWIDNVRLFAMDDPDNQRDDLFVPSSFPLNNLIASQPPTGRKGMLRSMYAGLTNSSMAANLSMHPDADLTFDWTQQFAPGSGFSIPQLLDIAWRTGDSPETRMEPWINVSSHAAEEEWAMLIEYLGAPIDPEDPADLAAKPWAAIRLAQRGTPEPWTDAFRSIRIEFANETWHNGAVSNQWFGWGNYYYVMEGGVEFGLVARYFSTYLNNQSPWFSQLHSNGKIQLVMGSNYDNYAEVGLPSAPLVGAIGHTTYVGPRWEIGETPNESFNDHGVQATLLGHIADFATYANRFRQLREGLSAQGIDHELLAYEGGPSGYALPGTAPANQVEISEQYGKSQAMAVAALDAWLDAHIMGFTDQGYLSMAAGEYWSSHTTLRRGYRKHVPWLALEMRNHFATGTMIDARLVESPSILWSGQLYPLLGSYAFREGNRLMVFLLSRKLDGQHSGHDWGDGRMQVTLRLPANPTGPATLHKLEGDPRANNRAAANVAIETETVTLNRETVIDLPPGAIYLYVIDTDLPSDATPLAQAPNPDVQFDDTGADVTWDAVPGAQSYRVLRSSVPQFLASRASEVFSVNEPSFRDSDATGGTTFFYRVSAVNAWGEAMTSRAAMGGTNPAPTLYDAPQIQSARVGDGTLALAWQRVTGATGYRIGTSSIPSGPYVWTTFGDVTSGSVEGLPNGRPLYYVIQSIGPLGRGPVTSERSTSPIGPDTTASLAIWDFTGYTSYEPDAPASSSVLPLTVSTLQRGAGLGTADPGYHPLDDGFGGIPHEDWGNWGATGGGSIDDAIARDLYFGFTVQPLPGYALSLSSLEAEARTYLFTDAYALLYYRLADGPLTPVPGAPIPLPVDNITQSAELSFDLAAVPALTNNRQPVEFRIYFYSPDPGARYCRIGFGGSRDGNDLHLAGHYTPVAEGYDGWIALHFSPLQIAQNLALPGVDPDRDRIPNRIEFLLGLNPLLHNNPNQALQISATLQHTRLRLPRTATSGPDDFLAIETSTNLNSFTEAARYSNGSWSLSLENASIETSEPDHITIQTPTTSNPTFFRLRADP